MNLRPKAAVATALLTILTALGSTASAEGTSNHATIFAGATTLSDHGDLSTQSTIGLEYAYHIAHLFCGGLAVDASIGDHNAFIVAPVIFLHFQRGLKIGVAPGIETDFEHTAFLLRGSVGYDFPIAEHFTLGPLASLDWVGGHLAAVYGIDLGWGF